MPGELLRRKYQALGHGCERKEEACLLLNLRPSNPRWKNTIFLSNTSDDSYAVDKEGFLSEVTAYIN